MAFARFDLSKAWFIPLQQKLVRFHPSYFFRNLFSSSPVLSGDHQNSIYCLFSFLPISMTFVIITTVLFISDVNMVNDIRSLQSDIEIIYHRFTSNHITANAREAHGYFHALIKIPLSAAGSSWITREWKEFCPLLNSWALIYLTVCFGTFTLV